MRNNKKKLCQGAFLGWLLVLSLTGCEHTDKSAEQEALDFLYANMPLPDSVDYPRKYWEKCVQTSLQARQEMPWGQTVPDREWKHFVLPVRVNNENLDDSRTEFYKLLKDRVRNKSMYGAIQEVNHWCHEHATYQPSDARTSSPLATMRSAIGRCGEESTFTVAALRAVGIPARQVYTPRWAHTDDNHAWVEAWANGEWYFLGACEPEAALNLGWFNEPASRGILMHTKVFGAYDGPEEVISKNKCYTEINVTSNYTPTSCVTVRALDTDSVPVEGATIDFRVYNYAEFYTVVSKTTGKDGHASLSCGRGDIVVWASKDGHFGFKKASVGLQDTVCVTLDKDSTYSGSIDLDIIPPQGENRTPEVSGDLIAANKKRLLQEDSIRNAYMEKVFFHSDDANDPRVKARANWKTIDDFMNSDAGKSRTGKDLLGTLRDKDFRDITPEVLTDVTLNTKVCDEDNCVKYVLCPRVSDEMITPYRQTLATKFAGKDTKDMVQWVKDSVTVDNSRNPQHLCMSPLGVLRHRTTDSHSRDIFFVAACRSIGIPSRINEQTGVVQTFDKANREWTDIRFNDRETVKSVATGTVQLTFSDGEVAQHPAYYKHFSLSRIENGRPSLLEFPENATWESTFADGEAVNVGTYMMVSGTRMADGSVLARIQFFTVEEGKTSTQKLQLRNKEDELRVIGTFNCENMFTNYKGTHKTILKTTGRGYYVVGLITSNHEPSTHVLHDLEEANIYLARWPHCFLMLFPSQEEYAKFRRQDFDDLPSNFVFGVADPETVKAMHIEELTHGSEELPILMLADTFNRVVWFNQGYTIGIGERIMKVIRQLMKTDDA